MLQLLLTILAVSMAVVGGLTLITQLELQNAMQDSRENSRRLDLAADALSSRLSRLPNIDNLVAPAPDTSFGWATLPASVAGINSTVGGIRFLYCPVGYNGSDDSMPGNAPLTVNMGSASYTARVRGGFVVNSTLGLDPSVVAARPVAILVSAGRKGSTPPSCADVKMVEGRAVVAGGLARVISDHRNGGVLVGSGESMGAEFFVRDGGNGNGLTADHPTSIDAALAHYATYRPASMTINITGPVTASTAAWSAFASASAESELRLRLIGVGSTAAGAAALSINGDTIWNTPADTLVSNIALGNITPAIGAGDTMRVTGNIAIGMPSARAAFQIAPGGDLRLENAVVSVIGNATMFIDNAGTAAVMNSTLSNNAQINSLINLADGSVFTAKGAAIGTNANRPVGYGITDAGAKMITGQGSSVAATAAAQCWLTTGGMGLKWSVNGIGSSSSVAPEISFPAPGAGATAAEIEAYDAALNERRQARLVNGSAFSCV